MNPLVAPKTLKNLKKLGIDETSERDFEDKRTTNDSENSSGNPPDDISDFYKKRSKKLKNSSSRGASQSSSQAKLGDIPNSSNSEIFQENNSVRSHASDKNSPNHRTSNMNANENFNNMENSQNQSNGFIVNTGQAPSGQMDSTGSQPMFTYLNLKMNSGGPQQQPTFSDISANSFFMNNGSNQMGTNLSNNSSNIDFWIGKLQTQITNPITSNSNSVTQQGAPATNINTNNTSSLNNNNNSSNNSSNNTTITQTSKPSSNNPNSNPMPVQTMGKI
jgi:hypothetical protein